VSDRFLADAIEHIGAVTAQPVEAEQEALDLRDMIPGGSRRTAEILPAAMW
jgi:hypothetical protein